MHAVIMGRLKDIQTSKELALQLEVPLSKLTKILYQSGTLKKYHIETCYRTFEIPKKDGTFRMICAPKDELMEIQKKIARVLIEDITDYRKVNGIQPTISHAFEKDKSIITNARVHRNKRYVLNMDLENFFEQFHFGRVKGFFMKNKVFVMGEEPAAMLANLCCYKGKLPQGAPTSPIISNLIANTLDMHLLLLARKYKLDYTRYADDLTFSTNCKDFPKQFNGFMEEVDVEIRKDGFSINKKKTRLQFYNSRQEVTGLVVNKKLSVPKEFYKNTRAMAHKLYTTGKYTINGGEGTLNQLEGRFSFINQLDYYNNQLDEQEHNFMNLNGREWEYARFIFYRYFYMTDKMLVVTEGKTDVLYIKAALKKFVDRYPNLIEEAHNKYSYKIKFLKRTRKLEYFLGIKTDGADTIGLIHRAYAGSKNWKGFGQELKDLGCSCQGKKVVLLYDNEQVNDKPLKKFKKQIGFSGTLEPHGYNILYNLFLLTLPLPEGESESEMEDLFSEKTLKTEIDGREFKRKIEKGEKSVYGKDVFSRYVYEHYEEIDFSGFLPLLDELNALAGEMN